MFRVILTIEHAQGGNLTEIVEEKELGQFDTEEEARAEVEELLEEAGFEET